MTYESITFAVADGVARVTLAQPDRGNPFDVRFCTEFARIADRCATDPTARCVLVEAEGPYFSVGLDLKSIGTELDAMPEWANNANGQMNLALGRLARANAPVVVAVHAMCVGGGVALAAAADFCIAATSARFYAAYCGVGLSCDVGGTVYLPRRLGVRTAAEFLMRNQIWSAAEACERGLITQVVAEDELSSTAYDLALELAQGPTIAFGEIKNLLLDVYTQPIETQLEQEARAMARVLRTEDARHAIVEVAARRKAVFHGR